jgi:hypothetical protein
MAEASSASITFEIPAYGLGDPEVPVLSDEQIVDLKEQLSDEDIASSVATEIVMSSSFDPEDWNSRPEEQELLRNPVVRKLLGDAAFMACDWLHGVNDALKLPAAEWPEGMTPAGIFSDALKRAQDKDEAGDA